MTDYVPWLRGLAEKGGKGVVNNIDARSLGRIAEELERLAQERDRIERAFKVLCWEVRTPGGSTISVSTRKHAEKVAGENWPNLAVLSRKHP